MSGAWYCPDCGAPFKTVERLSIHVDLHYAGRRIRSGLVKLMRLWWKRASR